MSEYELNAGLAQIQEKETQLLADLREAVRSQLALWSEIPALAWLAAQKDELFTITYCAACVYGLWPISLDENRWYASAWVDCATGELLDADDPRKPASDERVRGLLTKLHLVDPGIVVATLKQRAERGYDEANFLWMGPIRNRGGVSSPYVRNGELPEKMDTQLVESS